MMNSTEPRRFQGYIQHDEGALNVKTASIDCRIRVPPTRLVDEETRESALRLVRVERGGSSPREWNLEPWMDDDHPVPS